MLSKQMQRTAGITARRSYSVSSHSSQSTLSSARKPHASTSASTTRSSSHAASSRHARHFHSSRRSSFTLFGYKRKADDTEAVVQSFLDALGAEDAEKVSQAYSTLRKQLLGDPSMEASEYLSAQDISSAMRLLSQTSYINEDFLTVRRMSEDLLSLWHQDNLSPADYSSYVAALVNSGRLEQAYQLLRDATSSRNEQTDSWVPTSHDWNAYLRAYRDSRGHSYPATKRRSDKIPRADRDIATHIVLLESLFEPAAIAGKRSEEARNQSESELREILSQIARLQPNDLQQMQVDAVLLNGYIGTGQLDSAKELYDKLAAVTSDIMAADVVIALVRYEVSAGDAKSAKRQSQALVQAHPSARRQLTALLLQGFTLGPRQTDLLPLDELRACLSRVEAATGLLPDYTAYEQAMRLASSFEDALALLRDSHRDGISLSSGMLRTIVSKVPEGGANAEHLETIKTIYGDLGRSKLSDARSRDGVHDTSVYIALLKYCTREDVAELGWATTLMEDMKAHGLSLLNSEEAAQVEKLVRGEQPVALVATTSAATIVTSLMRNASQDHSQAFKAYSWMWAVDPDNIFSKQDWYDIIRTYTDLSFTDEAGNAKKSYVPSSIFFAFFEDMRKSGTPPDSPVYQAILHYYAREGGSAKSSSAEAVRLIHSLIKMDHYYDPDIGLMNRLMYAYSKTGNLDSAVGVWRSILMNRIPFNNVSISIILDVYGYLGDFGKAAKLWESLKIQQLNEQTYAINKKNLESFIEAACRTGRPAEAIEETFKALEWKDGALVDQETLKMLLKFVRSDSQAFHTLRERIQKDLPQYWPLLQNVAQPKAALGQPSQTQRKSSFSFSSLANESREKAAIQANVSSPISLQKP